MDKTKPQVSKQEKDNYVYCEECIANTREEKDIERRKYPVLVKLPLYIYPPKGKAVLMGYVSKCLNCQKSYGFSWSKESNRYSSDRVRQMLIDANRGKYTRGLTEAEICSPVVFKVREEDSDFLSYSRRFNQLLKAYTGEAK